jgi:hypothetical protein
MQQATQIALLHQLPPLELVVVVIAASSKSQVAMNP